MNAHAVTDTSSHVAALCATAGACASGVARVAKVAGSDMELYRRWIADGAHGCLDYMERYDKLRSDPGTLLEGARSIVVCAFSYRQTVHNAWISDYALGTDYHTVLRERLEQVAEAIRAAYGGETRVCVDSAPLRERYWAVCAGVGTTGLNGRLIVPGAGSDVVLGEILTTAALPPSQPLPESLCDGCGLCVQACPAGALDGTGRVDARRCLSCITIEQRGDLPAHVSLHGRIVGCDTCSAVCPASRREASRGAAHTVPELQPRPDVLALTPASAAAITRGRFNAIFGGSAVMRLRQAGLKRNARRVLEEYNQNNDTNHTI